MNSIIIIRPNDFEFTKEDYYDQKFKLAQDTNQYLDLRTINFADMMEIIVTEIGLTPELMGDSQTCYENSKNIYQICFVGYKQDEIANQQLNKIASYLNGDNVYGPAILINSKINDSYICEPDNITVDDFINILYSKFVHKGIFIPSDENLSVKEFDYLNHPLEYLNNENDYSKYKLFESEFLGFTLGFFGEDNAVINRRATKLIGKQKLYGNVIMFNKLPHEYHDLDINLFTKFSKLSYGPLKNRELTKDEQRDENKKENGLPIVINKYSVLEKRYREYKKLCHYCNKEITSHKSVCSGCHRMIYHDNDCQRNDWAKHGAECLYGKT